MSERPTSDTTRKELGLLLLVGIWLFVGLFGHSPWKPDEGDTFGVVYALLERGDLVVPHLAGEPFLDNPPLYSATAALLARAFAWLVPVHDGARLATTLFLGAGLACTGMAGEALYGRKARWMPVLILAGCVGLWERAHQLQPYSALVLAFALAALGLALHPRRPVVAGVALGLGIAVGFLSTGLFAPVSLATTALLLLALPEWRTRRYAVSLIVAFVASLPLLFAWPVALYARSPALLSHWFWHAGVPDLVGGLRGELGRALVTHARNLPWFAWPAWPLALWTLHLRWRGFGGGMRVHGIQMPVVMALVALVFVLSTDDPRPIDALPLLVPLALLGSAEIETMKRGHSAALDWFGILFWGFAGAVLWILWIQSITIGMAPGVARLFNDAQRGFVSPVQPVAVIVSVLLTLLWIALVRPARRSNRRALLNWFAGSLLVWGLYSTLWLPYQEHRRSYRPVALELRARIPSDARCVASVNLGETQRASFQYFAGLLTLRREVDPSADCEWLIAQGTHRESTGAPPGWTEVWEGARPGDAVERIALYRRGDRSTR